MAWWCVPFGLRDLRLLEFIVSDADDIVAFERSQRLWEDEKLPVRTGLESDLAVVGLVTDGVLKNGHHAMLLDGLFEIGILLGFGPDEVWLGSAGTFNDVGESHGLHMKGSHESSVSRASAWEPGRTAR